MKYFTVLTIMLVCLFIGHATVYAQCECSTGNCDYIIELGVTDYEFPASELKAAMGVSSLAGKRICIKAATYTNARFTFRNVEGTASAPVTIKNCGGQAIIDGGAASAILLWDSKYVRLLGNSCSAAPNNIKYGIRAKSGTNYVEASALQNGRITDIEIAFLEIGGDTGTPGSAGIKIIDQPGCDEDLIADRSDPRRWVMRNIQVHDNYVHNVGTEGMYIGKGAYFGQQETCGMSYSVSLRNVRIYNNIVRDTGWDGIQLKDADEDVKVYNNTITNYGIAVDDAQNEGIIIGTSVGDIYQNKIINGTGSGMWITSLGNYNIYNNLVINSGTQGMFINGAQGTTPDTDDFIRVVNNTVVKTGVRGQTQYRQGIWLLNSSNINSTVVVNNIFAGVPTAQSDIISGTWTDESNNIEMADASQVGFVDYQEGSSSDFVTNDYHLTSNSIAVDTGRDASVYPIANIGVDYDGEPRGQGADWDAGAYEFSNDTGGGEGWEIFLNAGGAEYTEVEGGVTNVWEGDAGTGHSFLDKTFTTYATGSTAAFGGPNTTSAPDEVLGTYRFTLGSGTTIRYNIPVPAPGTYSIELFFARKNADTYTSGDRRFNIIVEGQTVTTYDVYDHGGTGGTAASSFTYSASVTDNSLEIKFVAVPGAHAQINAIYARQVDAGGGESIDLFLNAGGAEYTEVEGGVTRVWEGDAGTGHEFLDKTFVTYATGSTAAFGGPNTTSAPDEVLGTYRFTLGSGTTIRYDIPVPADGTYDIELFFARKNADTYTSGARRFNIIVEGQTVTTYDVYDQGGTGGTAASTFTYSAEVTDGSLEIKFVAVAGAHAQINAINVQGPVQSSAMQTQMANASIEEPMVTEVYPNPSTDYVDLTFPEDGYYNVRVVTPQNEVFLETVLEGRKGRSQRLSLSGLADNQMFYLHVQTSKSTKTYRLLKSKQ